MAPDRVEFSQDAENQLNSYFHGNDHYLGWEWFTWKATELLYEIPDARTAQIQQLFPQLSVVLFEDNGATVTKPLEFFRKNCPLQPVIHLGVDGAYKFSDTHCTPRFIHNAELACLRALQGVKRLRSDNYGKLN